MQFKNKHKIRESNNVIEYLIQNNCNYVFIFELKQCENKSKNIDNNNNLHFNNNNLICKKQNKRYYFFNTLSIIIDLKVK